MGDELAILSAVEESGPDMYSMKETILGQLDKAEGVAMALLNLNEASRTVGNLGAVMVDLLDSIRQTVERLPNQ